MKGKGYFAFVHNSLCDNLRNLNLLARREQSGWCVVTNPRCELRLSVGSVRCECCVKVEENENGR